MMDKRLLLLLLLAAFRFPLAVVQTVLHNFLPP